VVEVRDGDDLQQRTGAHSPVTCSDALVRGAGMDGMKPACARRATAVEAPGPRYRHYPRPDSWDPEFNPGVWRNALLELASRVDDAVAIELHLPFCAVRCHYCGFDINVGADDDVIDRYIEALDREMALVAGASGRGREALQVHLSGGTPNQLADRQLERLMERVARHFRLLPETEISIECDPRRTSAMQLDMLRNLGFGRVAFGMADPDPAVQGAAGRLQSMALMRDVFAMSRAVGFDSVELDFVCGLPAQSIDSVARSVDDIVALGPDRITCLRYRHTPSRWWNQCAIDREHLPGPDESDALHARATTALAAAGYQWLGADRFVLDTDPLVLAREHGGLRRNALGFHALPVEHLLAFGNGRISDVAGTLARNDPNLAGWQRAVETGRLAVVGGCRRSADALRRRAVIDSLLCDLAVPASLAQGLQVEYAALAATAALGWVEVSDEGIRITTDGQRRLESLCALFDAAAPEVALG
jgi:oxygen-independent coproporphyrinogen-3 oxidase